MTVKEIEIFGFKSFAAKTRIELNREITAVVGPNGCGKSNILDAVKWVMGEKSAKSMRGDKMEDIIFSGTEHKKPAGYAQVDILFDNADHTLQLEYDQVKITRKLYRDGQSQYFINDTRVTRKEIENVFLDTGLGKASYSFMQQGQMDMILSSKPEERRYIFEEAAGIARFKSQKEEAEKKLENTDVNLTRLADILSELERELNIKKSQSKKTEQYNQLAAKKKERELKVHHATLSEMDDTIAGLNHKLEKKMADFEKNRQKILQLEEKILTFDTEREKLQSELHENDTANKIASEKIVQFEKNIELNQSRKNAMQNELATIDEQIRKVQARIQDLKSKGHSQKQLSLQLDNRLENAEKSLEQISRKTEETQKNLESHIEEVSQNQNHIEKIRIDLKTTRSEQAQIVQDLLNYLKQEKENWQKELVLLDEQSAQLAAQIDEAGAILNDPGQDHSDILRQLRKTIHPEQWKKHLENIGKKEHTLWNVLFEKGGIHARKEDIDEKILNFEKKIEDTEKRNRDLAKSIEAARDNITELMKQRETIYGDIKSFETQKHSFNEQEKTLQDQLQHEESRSQYFVAKHGEIEAEIVQLQKKETQINKEIEEIRKGMKSQESKIGSIRQKIERFQKQKTEAYHSLQNESQKSQVFIDGTNELEVKIGTTLGAREALVQELYNVYNLTQDELSEKFKQKKIDIEAEKNAIRDINREIQELGPINPLAIEELKTVESLYEHNKEQLDDIVKARKDVLDVIEGIRKKSETLFVATFDQISENFRTVFRKLFQGGNVDLALTERDKPLESGIDIQVQPPGKRARSLRLLSGGEKALTATALMFAIYMVRSSPFCVLDEIDAPLDDTNVGRFLNLVSEFKGSTQFMIITHNKKTMTHAQSIFGVTMEEPGVSTLLSVEVKSAS